MNIVIIGAGEVGFHLAKFLIKDDHLVTVVDNEPAMLRRASAAADVRTVQGHATDPTVLDKADVSEADLVVAVTSMDELNMLACMVAKKLGAKKTVVRVHAGEHVQDHQYFYKDTLGFDLTISPEEMAALEILRLCRGQNSMHVENFAGGRLQMRHLEILDKSPAVGKSLAEIKLPLKALVTAIVREHEVTIPRGDFVLKTKDQTVFLGVPDALDKAEKIIGGRQYLPRRVFIVGGGMVGLLVARDLTPLGVSVRLIEKDKDKAEKLSQMLAGAEVILGTGTDVELLNQEGIHRADVFVSLDESDEVNILSCQLAKNLGVNRTLALLSRQDYAGLVDRLGIDHAVSPRRLVARRIARYVRGEGRSTIASIHHGLAEVMDLVVEESFLHRGEYLHAVPFPVGSIVGALIRGEEVLIPRGDTRIEVGDHLLIFAKSTIVDAVEKLFAPGPEVRTEEESVP